MKNENRLITQGNLSFYQTHTSFLKFSPFQNKSTEQFKIPSFVLTFVSHQLKNVNRIGKKYQN